MRKFSVILLCMMLVMSLAGCLINDHPAGSNPPTTQTTPSSNEETTQPAVTDPGSNFEAPMLAISMPIVSEVKTDSATDTVLYSNTFQNVSLIMDDPDVAHKITLDLLNRLDVMGKYKDRVYEAAKSDYNGSSYWYPYSTSVTYRPERLDDHLFSFSGYEELFDGTPSSSSATVSVTYDALTGDVLTLKNILLEDYSADTLCEMIFDALSVYPEYELFANYKSIIEEKFSTNVPMNNWYFSETGLTFYFNSYEIAPHSLGTVYADIPYEKLLGLVSEQYFPDEKILYTGTMQATAVDLSSGSALIGFDRFAEINLSQEGNQVLLSTVGSVTDVRVLTGIKDEDGAQFIETGVIFAASGIGPGDAILIHLDASSAAQTLAVSYVSDGEHHLQMFRLNSDGTLNLYE